VGWLDLRHGRTREKHDHFGRCPSRYAGVVEGRESLGMPIVVASNTYQHPVGLLEQLPHKRDLLALSSHVFLVDTECIEPVEMNQQVTTPGRCSGPANRLSPLSPL
jgi:hypothetical protein